MALSMRCSIELIYSIGDTDKQVNVRTHIVPRSHSPAVFRPNCVS